MYISHMEKKLAFYEETENTFDCCYAPFLYQRIVDISLNRPEAYVWKHV